MKIAKLMQEINKGLALRYQSKLSLYEEQSRQAAKQAEECANIRHTKLFGSK
jgi:hypothetical protein